MDRSAITCYKEVLRYEILFHKWYITFNSHTFCTPQLCYVQRMLIKYLTPMMNNWISFAHDALYMKHLWLFATCSSLLFWLYLKLMRICLFLEIIVPRLNNSKYHITFFTLYISSMSEQHVNTSMCWLLILEIHYLFIIIVVIVVVVIIIIMVSRQDPTAGCRPPSYSVTVVCCLLSSVSSWIQPDVVCPQLFSFQSNFKKIDWRQDMNSFGEIVSFSYSSQTERLSFSVQLNLWHSMLKGLSIAP